MKYNASISVVGIADAQIQHVLMKLVENVEYLKDALSRKAKGLETADMEIRQIVANGNDTSTLEQQIAAAQATATAAASAASTAQTTAAAAQTTANAAQTTATAAQTTANAAATQTSLNAAVTRISTIDGKESGWDGKQDALTFDDEPEDGSDNPVKSNGIYDHIYAALNKAIQAKDTADTANTNATAALAAAKIRADLAFYNTDMGANVYRRIYLASVVPDTTKTYNVVVSFCNAYQSARTCVVWKNSYSTTVADGTSVSVPAYNTTTKVPGQNSITTTMTGDDFIRIDNIATTVDVIVKFSEV